MNEPAWIIPFVAVLLSAGLIFVYAGHIAKAALAKRPFDYLRSIGYAERSVIRPGDEPTERGPSYRITGKCDPARFYGYSKGERDVMDALGLDGDTYDSNWPS